MSGHIVSGLEGVAAGSVKVAGFMEGRHVSIEPSDTSSEGGRQTKNLVLTPHEKVELAADVVVFIQEKARGIGKNLSGKGISDVLVLAEMLGGESVD